MDQQDEIEALLRRAAPICHEASLYAQKGSAEIMATDAARKYLTRRAAANQTSGIAKWRIAGDELVRRHDELPEELKLSTTDAEQNRGLYYFRSARPAVVLTLRQEPHEAKDEPKALQLQWASVIDEAPVDFGGPVVTVYLRVPPLGHEPLFEVTARGESLTYRLCDLVGGEGGAGRSEKPIPTLPTAPRSGAIVRSQDEAAREGTEEDADDSRR